MRHNAMNAMKSCSPLLLLLRRCQRSVGSVVEKRHTIGLIPADGIGREVVPAAVEVLEACNAPIDWIELEAGFDCFKEQGTSLPRTTLATLREECEGALFGAVSSPSHRVEGYSSPIVAIRRHLELFANIRPVISLPMDGSTSGLNLLIFRENTECLYVKQETIEDTPSGKVATAKRIISERASERIGRKAFESAKIRAAALGRPSKVTIVHKSNVLSITDGLFRQTVRRVASEYPDVEVEEQLVDSCVYRLFRDPESFDVIVAPNMYGDIISDGAAALVGGLGIVPSANIGNSFCLAEPVHGSAPDIEGRGIANPIATIRAAAQLLEYLGDFKRSSMIEHAVRASIDAGVTTMDLGGKATTKEVTTNIISELKTKNCSEGYTTTNRDFTAYQIDI